MPSKLLTPRQHEILQLIADGLTSAEIAERLHRSVRTVESHRFEIGQRLGARNTPELLRKARLAGLLTESQRCEYDGTAPRTDSQALENMLLSLSAVAKSAETGASLLQNLCSRMVDAFGVQAAVISRVTERGRVEALASWPDSGTFPSSEWDLESSPCSRLRSGEIATIPVRKLPNGMRQAFAPLCTDNSFLTILPLHLDAETHIGVLCLVHDGRFDATRPSQPLLHLCSAWIASELCSSRFRDELQAMGFQLGALENYSQSFSFRCTQSGEIRWVSTRGREVLDGFAPMSTNDITALLESVTGSSDQDRTDSICRRLSAQRAFSGSFRCAKNPGGWARAHLTLEPVPDDSTGSCDFVGLVDFSSSSKCLLDEPVYAGALQLLVSKHPSPCLLLLGSGEIIAASAAWRDLLKGLDVLGDDASNNYLTVVERIAGRCSSEKIRSVLDRLADQTVNQMESMLLKLEHPLSDFNVKATHTVELTPIPDCNRVFVKHVPEIDSDGPAPSRTGQATAALTPDAIEPLERVAALTHEPGSHAFAWLFVHSPHAMCVASLEGLLLHVNPAMCEALEMTELSLTGYPFFKLFYPQDHTHVRELVNRLSAGLPVEEVVLPMKSSRGNRVLFEWTCPPVLPGTDLFTPVGRIL